jgi:hypothetical protein
MRTIPINIAAGQTEEFAAAGNYLQVRQSAVDLIIENPLTAEKVEASQGDDFQFDDFKSLRVTNTGVTDQLIKLTVSKNKKAGSAKVGGSVNVSGAVLLANGALTQGRATVTNANQAILAANANRRYLMIQNNDPLTVLRVTVDGNAATATQGFRVEAGSSFELPTFATTGAVNVMMETASAVANNVEFVQG